MNVISKLSLLIAVFGIAACNPESQLDINSFNIKTDNQGLHGYVITEQSNLMIIPEEYIHIHRLADQLLNKHWLQNHSFLSDLTELISLFKTTKLPEANVFIASLEAAKHRYLISVDNVDSFARTIQRDIDNDLKFYQQAIDELQDKINLLQTPEDVYVKKIKSLNHEIKYQSRQYSQLKNTFRQSLNEVIAKNDPESKLINDIKFDFSPLSRKMCSQYKGMSELLTTASENCVYINRDQLLFPFPSELKPEASAIIDHYAPQIWHAMTSLNGYFDTVENKQFFPENLNSQMVKARAALREKRHLCEHESAVLIEQYHRQIAAIKKKHHDTMTEDYLDQHLRIDTGSDAFISRFCKTSRPIHPFAKVYRSPSDQRRFARAYARKMLSEHPAQLHFAVSSDGRFSIPKSKQANMLIFDLPGKNGLITYEMVKNTDLPSIIKPETPNTTVAGHTLLAELDLTLRRYWGN